MPHATNERIIMPDLLVVAPMAEVNTAYNAGAGARLTI